MCGMEFGCDEEYSAGQQMSNNRETKARGAQAGHLRSYLSQMKLPLIERKPHHAPSRPKPKPNSKITPPDPRPHPASPHAHSQLNDPRTLDGNRSLLQNIQQQVRLILNRNHINEDYYNSDNDNFENNVEQQRQFLKMQRKKRESLLPKNLSHDYQQSTNDAKDNSKEKEPARTLDKPARIKERNYGRDKSSKPHFAKPKAAHEWHNNHKPTIDHHASLSELSKSIHLEDKLNLNSHSRQTPANRLEKKIVDIKKKLSKRNANREDKVVTEADADDFKSDNLFDNIHHYLINPYRLSVEHKHSPTHAQLTDRRKQLENKLKDIEQKRPHDTQALLPNTSLQSALTSRDFSSTGLQWRRIEVGREGAGGKVLSVEGSSFEQEVNRLGNLQQRNQQSLQRYLQHQRMLIDLKLVKSNSSKDHLRREYLQ